MATTLFIFGAQSVETPVGSGNGQPALLDNVVDAPSASGGPPSPPENLSSNTPVLSFPNHATISYYAEFKADMPQGYVTNTSIIARIKWRSPATANTAAIGLQMKATRGGLANANTRAFAAAQEANFTAPSAITSWEEDTLTLTSAASNLDSVVAGDHVRFRLYREAGGTMAGAFQLISMVLETV